MGFTSKCCAKTNLPIVHEGRGYDLLNEVVALLPNGTKVAGSYDGYGRVGGLSLIENEAGEFIWDSVKMVLRQHYAEEDYKDLPKSGNEKAQGHFMADEFLDYCLEHGPFKNYKAYETAFRKLANW
jgi:hypothetical protein